MTHTEENKVDLLASAWDDKLAVDYVDQWGELQLHKMIPELCNVTPTDVVLDIGCGSGATVRAIANKLSSGRVIGIDPTAKMIEIASEITAKKNTTTPITFLLAGAEKIPVNNESCDLVLAVNTLHHWRNVHAGLNEVLRILKPSGRFMSIDDLWEESIEYGTIPEQEDSTCLHTLKTRSGIVELLNKFGFAQISNNEYRKPETAASIITGYKV